MKIFIVVVYSGMKWKYSKYWVEKQCSTYYGISKIGKCLIHAATKLGVLVTEEWRAQARNEEVVQNWATAEAGDIFGLDGGGNRE